MAVPIAEAFILVKPDLSVFRAELKAGVDAEINKLKAKPPVIPVAVKITPASVAAMKREIADLPPMPIKVSAVISPASIGVVREEIAAVPAVITVTPVLSTVGKAALQREITSASASVPIAQPAPETGGEPPVLLDDVERLLKTREAAFAAQNRLAKQAAGDVPSSKAGVAIKPDFTGFKEAVKTGAANALKDFRATVLVIAKLAPGARDVLREEIKGITGATINVLPVMSKEAKAAAAAEIAAAKAGGNVPGAPTPGAQRTIPTGLATTLKKEQELAFGLAQAERDLAQKTLDLATATAQAGNAAKVATDLDKLRNSVLAASTGVTTEAAVAARSRIGLLATESAAIRNQLTARAEVLAKEEAFAVARGKGADAQSVLQSRVVASETAMAAAAAEVAAAQALVAESVEKAATAQVGATEITTAATAADRLFKIGETELARAIELKDVTLQKSALSLIARTQIASDALAKLSSQAKLIQQQSALAQRVVNLPPDASAATTSSLLAAAKKAETDAVKAGIAPTIASAAALKAQTVETVDNTAATAKNAAAQLTRSQAVATGLRGAAAATLSLFGLRGATLAATAPFLAGAAAVTVLAKSLLGFAKLETTLNTFQAVTGATERDMVDISEAAQQLGKDLTLPGVNANQAADALTQLAKAGLSVRDSISAARGTLQLATAAQIDNATATTLVANALNSFSLSGKEAVHVADLLANAASAAQGEISDFGQGMAQVSAVAAQVGVSLEDTTTLLTLLARAGLRGSDAGTSLRTAFLKLVAPTEKANELIQSLGINVRDAQGKIRPQVFADFAKATSTLAPAVRDAIAAEIFGQDAIRAALLAGRAGEAGFEAINKQLEKQGSAADLAAARTKGLAGSWENLKNQGSSLGNAIGGLLAPGFKNIADGAAAATKAVNDLSTAEKNRSKVEGAHGAAEGLKAGLSTIEISKQIANISGGHGEGPGVGLAGKHDIEFETAALAFLANVLQSRLSPALRETAENAEGLAFDLADASSRARGMVAPISELADAVGRINADKLRTQRLNELSASISGQLKFLAEQGKGAQGPAIDAAKQIVFDAIAELEEFGSVGTSRILKGSKQIAPFIAGQLREALAAFTGVDDLVREALPKLVTTLIPMLKALGPAGQVELRAVGKILSEAFAEGLADKQAAADAVANARQAVADAIEAGKTAVASSIETAKGNLESFGDTLADTFDQIIDANPIAEKIKGIDKELDALEERTTRRSLRFNLSQAKEDLEDLRKTLVTIGAPNAAQQKQIAKVLRPLKEDVASKTTDIKKFDLTNRKENLEDLQTAAKKAARDGIEVLVDQFLDGKISAGAFASKLSGKLQPALDILKTKAGKNLGMRFEKSFTEQVDNLVKQAQFLVGFLGGPAVSKAVNPQKTKNEQAVTIQKARDNLAKALAAQVKTEKNTAKGGPLELALRAVQAAIINPKKGGKTVVPKPRTKEPDKTTGTVKSGP